VVHRLVRFVNVASHAVVQHGSNEKRVGLVTNLRADF
jgi:hypothetical protein